LCYWTLNEYSLAQYYFQHALNIFVLAKAPRDAVRARRNLGRNWLSQGNADVALRIFRQALAEAEQHSGQSGRAECLGSIGQALEMERHPDRARAVLEQTIAIHRAIGDRTMESLDLHLLGTASAALGDGAAARDYFTRACNLRLEIGLRDPAVDSLVALADLEHAMGHNPAALDAATRALKMMESIRVQVPNPALRASYYSRRGNMFDLLISLAAPDDSPASAQASFLAAERGRGRALIDLLAEGETLSTVPPGALRVRRSIERQIDLLALRLSTAAPSAAEPLRHEVESLLASREEIEAGIRRAAVNQKLTREFPARLHEISPG
jgi:tetratricopeptide (TPR) repeat protein